MHQPERSRGAQEGQRILVKEVRAGDVIIERSQLFMTTRGLDWLAHKLIERGYQVNYYKGKIA